MKDKYIPELIMSVIKKEPLAFVDVTNPCDYDWESTTAICIADLRRILEDIFKEAENERLQILYAA